MQLHGVASGIRVAAVSGPLHRRVPMAYAVAPWPSGQAACQPYAETRLRCQGSHRHTEEAIAAGLGNGVVEGHVFLQCIAALGKRLIWCICSPVRWRAAWAAASPSMNLRNSRKSRMSAMFFKVSTATGRAWGMASVT